MADLAPCKIGDRIKLIEMTDDPFPIPPGTTGTVLDMHENRIKSDIQITVKWDIARSLSLIWPHDTFEVIE